MNEKKILKRNNTTSKNFSYSLGDVSFNLTLRTDIKQDLKDCAEILKVASKEINEEIEKI